MDYTATQWMQVAAVGSLFGALGQAIRVIPGLKKLYDAAAEQEKSLKDEFSGSRLIISLLIGAVAGVLGAISLDIPLDGAIQTSTILALLGVGYSGADFIEAFMARYKPAPGAGPGAGTPAPPPGATTGLQAKAVG
jgi:galactitol-specific phosphotransferase system IIC component